MPSPTQPHPSLLKIASRAAGRSCALAAMLAVAGLLPAAAQDVAGSSLAELSLESLLDMPVTGASRFVQRRSQSSSAVKVITREEILALGYRTLAEVMGGVAGAVVSTDHTYDYLGVRGFLAAGDYSTRVLLLVDGNRINDPLFDQAFLGGEFPLDLDAVERVEFVPGQGSAVYGGNALFGVVNVITREAPRGQTTEVAASAASGADVTAHAAYRLPWGDGGLQLMASRQVRGGTAVFDASRVDGESDGWARGVDFTRRTALYLRADQGGFTASLLYADRIRATPMAVDLVYGDPRNAYRDTYSLLNLEYSHATDAGGLVTARAFAGHYRFTGDYLIDYPPVTLNHDDAVTVWRGVEARYRLALGSRHRLVAGIELQDIPLLEQRNLDLDPVPETYVDDRRQSWRAALYAEDQWSLTSTWELHAGVRADRTSAMSWETSPRLALMWRPDRAWSFKLIHGRAFRPPNAYEAFYEVDGPAGYRINPDLVPERVRGTEFAAEWRPLPEWRLSTSLYRTRASGLFLLSYDAVADRYEYDNLANLHMSGGEVEAEYAQGSLRWRASYGWAHTHGDGEAASTYPMHVLKGQLIWPLPADWTVALESQVQSSRGAAAGFGLAHLTLRGEAWTGGPTLTLGVRNLADRRIDAPGSDPERQPLIRLPGREWRLEARWPLAH